MSQRMLILSRRQRECGSKAVPLPDKLRATPDGSWPELFDELYVEYSSGRMFGTLNFTEYLNFPTPIKEVKSLSIKN